ncbi:endonuclease/exonuclease/phosphatase family protein [Cellulomonas palmilytica]|uniref:endonuclease/exonuclease/phosphatase family protein n=1 Tax=Cellulomonas palmilytica TaxID=2608402 RepID=UPI001F34A28E|nr:endonuclease/exonuclease/phosphatase family protein [Cellulomonas palmilytica]UJP41255.1 endonuclease/exonuclease/phosphatase family protein [Cellulomonas palmilytica]
MTSDETHEERAPGSDDGRTPDGLTARPPDDGTPTRVWLLAALVVATLELVRASGPLLDHAFASGVVTVGVTALATYAAAGLVAGGLLLATRAPGGIPSGRTVIAGAAVLAVLRVVLQALDGDARYWLGLVSVAWAVGVLVLATAFVAGRTSGPRHAALGLVVGCGLSAGLQVLLGTWDAVWRSSWVGWVVAVVVALAPLAAFRVTAGGTGAGAPATSCPRRLWAVGPFLAIAVMIGANPAFLASQSGIALGWAGVAVVAATGLGGWLLLRPDRWPGAVRVGAAVLVVVAVALAMLASGVAALVAVVVLDVVLAVVLVGTLSVRRPAPLGTWRAAGAAALAGLGVIVPLLGYMIDYDVPLPFDNAYVLVAAAVVVAVTGLHHRTPLPSGTQPEPELQQPARVRASRLLLVPPVVLALVGLVPSTTSTHGSDVPARAAGDELTVVSWNLHYGVSPFGGVDLEAAAATIEDAGADVVLLQEVERGWVLGGGADMATWLARRLGMTVEYAPAADRQFGNAVLARSGLTDVAVTVLPYGAGPQGRSAVSATVTTAAGETVRVTSVHLQHRAENTPTRLDQLATLLDAEPVTGPSVLGGDLNAQPGWPEIELLTDAGWVSAVDEVGDPDVLTSPSDAPAERIDWVFGQQVAFASADVLTDVTTSDHFPLVVRVTIP